MTEHEETPLDSTIEPVPVQDDPSPIHAPIAVERRRGGGTPVWFTLLLTAALAGGGYWIWTHPKPVDVTPEVQAAMRAETQGHSEAQSQAVTQAVAPIQAQIQSLADRVIKLEQAPPQAAPAAPASVPSPSAEPAAALNPDLSEQLAKISARMDALSARQDAASANSPSPPAPAAAPDPAIAGQKAALEALAARIVTLEQTTAHPAADPALADQKSTLTTLASRVEKLEQGAGHAEGEADRAVRLQAAEAALQNGQPIGDLPGAPPALARFATAAPPTEDSLRASFPQMAEAARAASRPAADTEPFLSRILAKVQQSVTVRQGDHVVVGDPAAGILSRAQDAIATGNLPGAVAALHGLNGHAAEAAHDWIDQAQALLDARAALAAMAAHG